MNRDRPLGWEEVDRKHQKFIKQVTVYSIIFFILCGFIYIHLSTIWSFPIKYRGETETVSFGMHYEYIHMTFWNFSYLAKPIYCYRFLFFGITEKIYTNWNYIVPFYMVLATSFGFFVANYAAVGFFFPFMTKQVSMSFKSIRIRIDHLGRYAKQMSASEVHLQLKHIIEEHNETIEYFANLIFFSRIFFVI